MRISDQLLNHSATGLDSLGGIANCLLFLAEEAEANKEIVLRDLLKAAAVYAKERADTISPYAVLATTDGD
jgi:hypothetical protein